MTVRSSDAEAVPYAAYTLADRDGTVRAAGVSSAEGEFRIRAAGAPPWILRVSSLGFGGRELPLDSSALGEPLNIQLDDEVLNLAGLEVASTGRSCPVPRGGEEVSRRWAAWQEILVGSGAPSPSDRPSEVAVEKRDYRLEWGEPILLVDTVETSVSSSPFPLRSISSEALADGGFVQGNTEEEFEFFAPDAEVLLSNAFVQRYCFETLDDPERGSGLSFRPAGAQHPGVAGELWLPRGPEGAALITFTWVHLPFDLRIVTGRTSRRHRTEAVDTSDRYGGEVVVEPAGNGYRVASWTMRWPVPVYIAPNEGNVPGGWYVGLEREWEAVVRGR